ncbi:GNAT family N-acetyltransferase [Patescibacteria group bacterium]|nr:GNAT family N-acetyltransferase [Patescibacteria group bacterium]
MIEFHSPLDFPKGTIARLLKESYGSLVNETETWEKLVQQFDDADEEVYTRPEIANCTFITTKDKNPIGLGCFDPRKGPEYGIIGHNCIIPSEQGNKYGQQQIKEIFRRLRERGIQKARVSTGTGKFAAPARQMYESCEFIETRRFKDDGWEEDMVEYEIEL